MHRFYPLIQSLEFLVYYCEINIMGEDFSTQSVLCIRALSKLTGHR